MRPPLPKPALALVCVLANLAWTTTALGWGTIDCPGQSQYRISYPNDVWPLRSAGNMASGGWSQAAVLEAMSQWNDVIGAGNNLSKQSDGYQYCDPPHEAGYGVTGWDDGSCTSWGPGQTGVHLFLTDDCTITRSTVFFNVDYSYTSDEPQSVAMHELGHYQYYDHNW